MSKKVFKHIIYLSLITLIIILLSQTFTIAFPDVTLGSGVTISDGTIIKLTGLNCNLTVVDNHIVDAFYVYSNYLLINASLNAPSQILGLSYSYSDDTKQINITCYQDTEADLYVNITDYGAGIKVYGVSKPANITSVSWSPYTFSFTVNAPSGVQSTTEVYWPYGLAPTVTCTPSCNSWGFDPQTKIVTLNVTHSSPATISLEVNTAVETDKANYQQTETVYITGSGFTPGVQVTTQINDPTGTQVFVNQTTTDSNGNYTTEYIIPATANTGTYTIFASTAFDPQATNTFTVLTDAEPPQLISLTRTPSVVTILDSVEIRVRWSDNVGLQNVVIWENKTGWQSHPV